MGFQFQFSFFPLVFLVLNYSTFVSYFCFNFYVCMYVCMHMRKPRREIYRGKKKTQWISIANDVGQRTLMGLRLVYRIRVDTDTKLWYAQNFRNWYPHENDKNKIQTLKLFSSVLENRWSCTRFLTVVIL